MALFTQERSAPSPSSDSRESSGLPPSTIASSATPSAQETRTVTVRYDRIPDLSVLPAGIELNCQGELLHLTYAPETLPTADLLGLLQQAGTIREMTVQPQNIDHLIAAMYREMDL